MELRIGRIVGHLPIECINPTEWSAYPALAIKRNPDKILSTLVGVARCVDFGNSGSDIASITLRLSRREFMVIEELFSDLDVTAINKTRECQPSAANLAANIGLKCFYDRWWLLSPTFYSIGMLMVGVGARDRDDWLGENDQKWIEQIKPVTIRLSQNQNDGSESLTVDEMTQENIFLLMLIIYVVSQSKRIGCRLHILTNGNIWRSDRNCWRPFVELHDEIEQILSPNGKFVIFWLNLCLARHLAERSENDRKVGRDDLAKQVTPDLEVAVTFLESSKAEVKSRGVQRAKELIVQVLKELGQTAVDDKGSEEELVEHVAVGA